MLVVKALRTALRWRLLVILPVLQLLCALLPALAGALLLGGHPPVDAAGYGGLDLFLAMQQEPAAWGDWEGAARFFGPTGMDRLGSLFDSGALLSVFTWQLLGFLLVFTLLWPGAVRLLSGREGFWDTVRRAALPVLCVTIVQTILYWIVYRLMLSGWGHAMQATLDDSPTEFLAIILSGGRLLAFLAVMLFLKLVFDLLKTGLALEEERNPFKLLWRAFLTAGRNYPRLAGVFALLGGLGVLIVLSGGFNIATLLLRDYLLLVGWAYLVEVWTPQ